MSLGVIVGPAIAAVLVLAAIIVVVVLLRYSIVRLLKKTC